MFRPAHNSASLFNPLPPVALRSWNFPATFRKQFAISASTSFPAGSCYPISAAPVQPGNSDAVGVFISVPRTNRTPSNFALPIAFRDTSGFRCP